jgi:hypothetical protein
MSEYQYVIFRAIDAPVSPKNLQYMQKQSTRAEITEWSFENEYHFGDFSGDEVEMLRRGYDFHLHYANFGTRKLMLRLPTGLPDPAAAKAYFEPDSLYFTKDAHGPGGILTIEPYFEPDDLDEIWDFNGLVNRLIPLRAEIMDGDLRPLYLAHLAVARDANHDPDEQIEAPVPAGLEKPTKAQYAMAEFYGISKAKISAAARKSPPLEKPNDSGATHSAWLADQKEARKVAWLAQLMADPHSVVRNEIMAEYQKSRNVPLWPTARSDRKIGDIESAAAEIQRIRDQKAAELKARQRAEKLANIARDPTPTLRRTEELATERSIDAYEKIARKLANLREALAGSDRANLAEQQAMKLKISHPKLHHLTSALRKKGFLKK